MRISPVCLAERLFGAGKQGTYAGLIQLERSRNVAIAVPLYLEQEQLSRPLRELI
jgi:hypothetical protein